MTPKIKSPSKPKTSPPKQKPVSVLDFFGMAAVQQEERKTVATKRKSVSVSLSWCSRRLSPDKPVLIDYLFLYL